MSKQPDISQEAGAAISLHKGAAYLGIDYGRMLELCSKGEIETRLAFPGSKRRMTTRTWCEEARDRWSAQSSDVANRPAVAPLAAEPVLSKLKGKALLDYALR